MDIDFSKIDPKEYEGKVVIARVPSHISVKEMERLKMGFEQAFAGCKRVVIIPKNMHLLFSSEEIDLEQLCNTKT